MIRRFVEVMNGFNWGKFMLARFDDEEWGKWSQISPEQKLIRSQGWSPESTLILDLATGEGALFRLGGSVKYDLDKHQIWVCPMYAIFLDWLWSHREYHNDIETIPELVDLRDKKAMEASAFYGHRRGGPWLPTKLASGQILQELYAKKKDNKGQSILLQISLEPRPVYCDRGSFLARLDWRGGLDIDGQDGWPRYYFDEDRAKLEIAAWLDKRGFKIDAEMSAGDLKKWGHG